MLHRTPGVTTELGKYEHNHTPAARPSKIVIKVWQDGPIYIFSSFEDHQPNQFPVEGSHYVDPSPRLTCGSEEDGLVVLLAMCVCARTP